MATAEVKTPPFTKGKKQRALKQKYTILQGVLPISLISDNTKDTNSTIDKIVKVCCALVNFCLSVVGDD